MEFRRAERVREVLLIGVHKEFGVLQCFVVQEVMESLGIFFDPLHVRRVHDVDKRVHVVEVVGPEGAQLELASNVPAIELDALVLEGFDVEANGGDRVDDLVELHLVEDGGLAGGVEAQHEEAHLFLAPGEGVPHLSEYLSHLCLSCSVV